MRVIFTPPSIADRICPSYEQLAYVEYFTAFSRDNNTPYGMYTTSTALHPDGRRQVAVFPVSQILMTCHIAPRFLLVPRNMPLNRSSDLLSTTKSFFFNHFVNHYVYKLFEHWRKRAGGSRLDLARSHCAHAVRFCRYAAFEFVLTQPWHAGTSRFAARQPPAPSTLSFFAAVLDNLGFGRVGNARASHTPHFN